MVHEENRKQLRPEGKKQDGTRRKYEAIETRTQEIGWYMMKIGSN